MSKKNIFCCAQQLILKRPDHMLVDSYRLFIECDRVQVPVVGDSGFANGIFNCEFLEV
ncbi:hypothetical protein HanXRQr2_Chr12g0547521 [Helianthus annuus]|nr:hypothetical protein HanXRQr2_Chr12g0547521 [Helianthus annuus]KAJ0863187.1 hypothetical protein HanPSC8_Chr12g0527011 [Helianthus annuus]